MSDEPIDESGDVRHECDHHAEGGGTHLCQCELNADHTADEYDDYLMDGFETETIERGSVTYLVFYDKWGQRHETAMEPTTGPKDL